MVLSLMTSPPDASNAGALEASVSSCLVARSNCRTPALPVEIMAMVFNHITRVRDRLAIMATSKAWHQVCQTLLYRTLLLDDGCIDILDAFAKLPDTSDLVRSFFVSWDPFRALERFGADVDRRTSYTRTLIITTLGRMNNLDTLVLGSVLPLFRNPEDHWPIPAHMSTALTRLDIHLSQTSFPWLKQLCALTHLRLRNIDLFHSLDGLLHPGCRLQWVSGSVVLLEECITRKLLVDHRAVVVPLVPTLSVRGMPKTYRLLHMAKGCNLVIELLDVHLFDYPGPGEFPGIVGLRLRYTGYYARETVRAETVRTSLRRFVDADSLALVGKMDFISGLDDAAVTQYLREACRDTRCLGTVVDSKGRTWTRTSGTNSWYPAGTQRLEKEWYDYDPFEV